MLLAVLALGAGTRTPSAIAACTASPQPACIAPYAALTLIKEATPGRERMKLSMKALSADVDGRQLGDPVNGTTRYDLCIYDGAAALVGVLTIDRAGAICANGKPCWQPIGDKGYRYRDVAASADGVQKIVVLGGPAGHGKLNLKAGNAAGKQQMAMPTGLTVPLTDTARATVQLVTSDGGCFGATLTRILRAEATSFSASGVATTGATTTLGTSTTTSSSLAASSTSTTTTRPTTTSTSTSTSRPTTTSTSTSRPTTTSTSTSTSRPTTSSTSTSTSRPTTTSTSTSTSRPTTTSTSTSTTHASTTSTSTSTSRPTTTSTSRPTTTSTSSSTTLASTTSTSTSTTHASTTSTSTSTSRPSTTSTSTSTSRPTSTSTSSSTSTTPPSTTSTSTLANQPPRANAGPDQSTQTLVTVAFSGAGSTDPDGSISTYQWAFGDGATGTGMTSSHAYAHAGTYTVTLTVTDNKGAVNSDTAVVTAANRPPIANAGLDHVALQATSITFDGSGSSDPDGTIVSWLWSFGDGATGSGVAPSHVYVAPGSYTATLIVVDDKNATAVDTCAVTVSSTGNTAWARRMGGIDTDGASAVAADGYGNVFVVGTFRGTVDFGGVALASAGGSDWFLAKYSPSNGLAWARAMGGTSDDVATDVAVDPAGNPVVTGRIAGTANLGGSALATLGASDIAIGKYDGASGAHLWSKRFGGDLDDSVDAVAVDGNGNVVMTGYFRGTVDFGTGPLTVPFDTDLDVYVAKLTSAGATLWAKNFTNSGNDRGYGIAVDAGGNIALTGTFSNSITFGGSQFTSASGMVDAYVAKLTSSGGHVWSRQIGAPDGNEGGNAVAFDGSGNVFLLGYALKPVDMGGGTLAALGGTDVLLAKYGAALGAHLWSRRLGGAGNDYAFGLAVDANGNVAIAGSFDAPATFGGASLTPIGADDAYVAKFSSSGSPTWSRQLGGASSDVAKDLAFTPSGWPVTTGYFYDSGTFGGATLTSAGLSDAFVTSLTP